MDLFGNKEHDARHDALEQEMRNLVEQVAQLTIELGQARADIDRLQAEKMDTPSSDSFDADIEDAKAKLDAAKAASADAWRDIYPQLMTSLGKVRDAVDAAGTKEPEASDDKTG